MSKVNFILAASTLGYAEGFSSTPDPEDYEKLPWRGTAIPKRTLELAYVELIRKNKHDELLAAFNTAIVGGYNSDALEPGTFRRYPSDLQGQIAVVGAVGYCTPQAGLESGTSFTLPSDDLVTGMRTLLPHNLEQLRRLLGDIGEFTNGLTVKLASKVGQIMSARTGNINTDLNTIEAVVW